MKSYFKFQIALVFGLLFLFNNGISAPFMIDLASPRGNLHCLLTTDKGQLIISVVLDGNAVIEKSSLVMSVDGIKITNGVKTGKIQRLNADETFSLLGLHSTGKNHFNGTQVSVTHIESGIKYTLEAKVFDDAVAFRFVVPGDENVLRKPDEATDFRIPEQTTLWYHDLYMHYEGVHTKNIIDTIRAGRWVAPPLTVKLSDNNGYFAITEANLVNYPGMALQSDGKNGFIIRLGHNQPPSYPYVLRYSKEDVERLSKIAEVKGTITTPWRVIIAGKDLNTIVNSDAIYSLCPPPDKNLFPEGTDWIRPGRAVWKYLDGGGDGTLTVMKQFSKQAGELGFEYNILEGFWSSWPDDSIKSLVDYSRKLGVGIIVWKHSKDLRDADARQKFFQRLHDLGIAGIKIDFFDHEAKEVIDLYESIAKETAPLKLVLIFHGANKPTGLSRTYPNILIYEGVKGMEASKLIDRATHETTIPFTRMLAGPADYSVCHFGTRRQNTTWTHQVATAAIFAAPLITYASTPAHILENPGVEMIKSIPSVWDETIVLPPSEIGEIAVYAQKKGTTWFLSVINGIQPKTIKIPLSFLGASNYKTMIMNDNPTNQADAVISNGEANKNNVVSIELGAGGGFMTRFTVK